MNALVTFGCSWTVGMGSWYVPDKHAKMSQDEYNQYQNKGEGKQLKSEYCFRTLLARKHDYVNINLSKPASSNSKQFRRAEEYFNTDDHKKYDNVVVLWGLTSTARMEFWNLKDKKYKDSFMTDDKEDLTNILRKNHYDHDIEVKRLSTQIQHWDKYFNMIGVKNYWFDTFNHHDYDYESPNMIMGDDNPRDLMSALCKSQGLSFKKDSYHFSDWNLDSDRIKFLLKRKLVNPISHHPNKQAHILLADIIDKHIL
jgi:hypothetical protein